MKSETKRADAIAAMATKEDCSAAWELAHVWSGFTDGDETHAQMTTAIREAIDELRRLTAIEKRFTKAGSYIDTLYALANCFRASLTPEFEGEKRFGSEKP